MPFTAYEKGKKSKDRIQPRLGPVAYTEDWFKARKNTIGASEAAGVCGLSRYTQPLEIYNSKKSPHIEEEKQTPDQRRGHIFEGAVLQLYDDKISGTLYTDVPMLIHPEHEFMSATPDALWTPDQINLDKTDWSYHLDYIPVDAKTTRHWSDFGEEGSDDIPQEYVMQAQQQMAVTGATRCDLPVLRGLDVTIYTVKRNEELLSIIFDAEKEMIDRIENNDPPEPNWEHPKTYGVIRKTFSEVVEEFVELDRSFQHLWDESRELAKQKTFITKEIETKKAKILHALGTAGYGKLPDGRMFVRKTVKVAARSVPESSYVRLDCKKGS